MSLRERAVEAHRRWEAERVRFGAQTAALKEAARATEEEEIAAQTRTLAMAVFGEEPEAVQGYVAVMDGLRLKRIGSGLQARFRVLWPCVVCGQTMELFLIGTLADLGRAYEDLEAHPERFCAHCRMGPDAAAAVGP